MRHSFLRHDGRRFLEPAAKLREAISRSRVAVLFMDLLQLRRQFGSATFIAGAEVQVQEAFENDGVPRDAL